MSVLHRFVRRIERQHLAVALAVLLVGLSGCAGLGGTADNTTGDGPTGTPVDGGPGDGPTATPEGDGTDTNGTGTPTIEETDATASEVIGPAVAAIQNVEAYRYNGTLQIGLASANRQQTSQAVVNTSVNRTSSRLASVQRTSSFGQTITSETYIVNGTVYQYSPQLARTYNSEWIRIDLPNGTAERFNRNDELAAHRVMLQNSSVAVEGIQSVDGQRAYRLNLTVNTTALNAFYGFDDSQLGVDSIQTTVWIDADSDRLIRAAGTIQQTITTQGQTVDTTIEYDERFTYGPVDVTLPDAAGSAVSVNQSAGTGV